MSTKAAAVQPASTPEANTETAFNNESNVELLLKKSTTKMVADARTHFSIENNQGKFSDDFYEKMLPSDIPYETVKRLHQHDSDLVAATALITGEAFISLAKKDPKLQELSVSFKGNDKTFSHVVKREVTVGKNKTFAVVSSSVKSEESKGSKGELSRVRSHIQRLGASLNV